MVAQCSGSFHSYIVTLWLAVSSRIEESIYLADSLSQGIVLHKMNQFIVTADSWFEGQAICLRWLQGTGIDLAHQPVAADVRKDPIVSSSQVSGDRHISASELPELGMALWRSLNLPLTLLLFLRCLCVCVGGVTISPWQWAVRGGEGDSIASLS